MANHRFSRRGFFQSGASATLGMALPTAAPPCAWIIVALNWEYNDEFSYMDGESPRTELFYDRCAADIACQRLCDEFFQAQTPVELEFDWDIYFFPDDVDEETLTWAEARAAGFPDPYYVLELSYPGAPSS